MTRKLIITAGELAKVLNLAPRTIHAWARAGKIPRLKLSGKVIRFNLSEVEQSLSKRKSKSPKPKRPTILSGSLQWHNLKILHLFWFRRNRPLICAELA